ncbi:HNH endonuclease signature motif containing protein [Corynebacterium flavescens]|uniref:HNH endonuclease signature motif containing protein n=1 Tax=Corynebacterium flavescens TaxID=28028 RepID=UPI003FD03E0F
MDALEAYIVAAAPGMDILAAAWGKQEGELLEMGASDTDAREILGLAHIYFGPTAYTAMQAAARGSRHVLSTLRMIERYAQRLSSRRSAWLLRKELCTRGESAAQLERRARELVRELAVPRSPSQGVRLTRRARAPWTLTITGPSDLVAQLSAAIDPQSPLDSVQKIFFGGGAGSAPAAATNVIIELDQLDKVVSGRGDEVTVTMTNGATITGAELARKRLLEHGYVTLIHPLEGPVNLYRASRHASRKQRLMMSAENPRCAWPGCNHPADSAQAHHLKAWSRGGETNPRNLATCCAYHNGVNSDDPLALTSRGRLERIAGKVVWIPPWARP